MTLCLFFSLALPHLVGSLLPANLKCSPVRRAWDVRAAAMMAWRVSPPACLPVVDLPMLPRRCRLVGRGGERGVFIPGSVMAICPVLVSPCVSFLISLCVSLRSSCLRCVFLVSFSSRSPVACACSICPRARLVPSSRRPVSSCVSGGGGSSCAACLTCPDGVLLISSYRLVGRDGERDGAARFRSVDFMVFSCIRNQ